MTIWTEPKSVDDAIAQFCIGRAFTHGRLHSDGTTLMSYGLPIARVADGRVRVLNKGLAVKPDGSRSQTTVRHIGKVLRHSEVAVIVDEL